MMRFRYIHIPRLLFQILRPNYALKDSAFSVGDGEYTNGLYRLLLSILWTLQSALLGYYEYRLRWYMIAACEPTYGHIERVLQVLYGEGIYINRASINIQDSYLYDSTNPAQYLYSASSPEVYWGTVGVYDTLPIIMIPQSLMDDSRLYNKFIQDLNTIIPFYLNYVIETY